MRDTDLLLVRCRLAVPDALLAAARQFCERSGLGLQPRRVGWSAEAQLAYVYAQPQARERLATQVRAELTRLWTAACPAATDVDVSRLALAFDAPGRSLGAAPRAHYVVETDPEPGWFDEISRWYDVEHMPGLAAVDGCIHARRFLNRDGGPLSLACYDLVSADVVQSPAWLAVRATAWSDIARPHFTNTRRTMLRVGD